MSALLWRHFFEDDIDGFRQTLANALYIGTHTKGTPGSTAAPTTLSGSPGRTLASSPVLKNKGKSRKGAPTIVLTRADVNFRDGSGNTLLHYMASSTGQNAFDFALAFLQVPFLDLYVQDLESGWTALHRALYNGNVRLAQALMEHDIEAFGSLASSRAGGLIKIKDREGNSPFDLYSTSVAVLECTQSPNEATLPASDGSDTNETSSDDSLSEIIDGLMRRKDGDELFTFGSNKNLSLAVGNEDDRQFPEKISLHRPPCLIRRLNDRMSPSTSRASESPVKDGSGTVDLDEIPAVVKFKPMKILDVQMAKYHTAVLTSDAEANLQICGFGPGGRLGTGDTATRFRFTSILGGGLARKRVAAVALGQYHTVAVTDHGEVFTWGSNKFGQLGSVPQMPSSDDEEPIQSSPRQLFSSLKREMIIGCAASALHSVVFSSGSLFTFGKNEGQLGLVESNAASLQVQSSPRKVAASLFSSPIKMVSATDRATVCLLDNHEVYCLANYGYSKITFAAEASPNNPLPSHRRAFLSQSQIVKVRSSGDAVCAVNSQGEVYMANIKIDPPPKMTSTTNPNKIRGLLSPAQKVWSLRKSHMAVQDVDVSQDGSIIICTKAGSVWKRVRRAKIQDSDSKDMRSKAYKFSRVPSLTRVCTVRSNSFGAFAAVRLDDDIVRANTVVSPNSLWRDLAPLCPLTGIIKSQFDRPGTNVATSKLTRETVDVAAIRHGLMHSPDLESEVRRVADKLANTEHSAYDVRVGTTCSELRIPCHEFILAARSPLLRRGLREFRQTYFFSRPDVVSIEYDSSGQPLLLFQGIDVLTLLSLILFVYTDGILDVWNFSKAPTAAVTRYRHVRGELIKLAFGLETKGLEQAARMLAEPAKLAHQDFDQAIKDPTFFDTADLEIELDGPSAKVHSAIVCQRCPFFEAMFHGQAAGGWVRARRENLREPFDTIKIDLKHVDPMVFSYVLRHLYVGADESLFDTAKAADLDGFLDLIMDVLSLANELMLDQLAEICQKVLSNYTTARSICQLVNTVAPCSVTQFKKAALEYICLNLEAMLENRLLSELDEDLIAELDNVVQENQKAAMPTSKGGMLEAELHATYPELAAAIKKSQQDRISEMIEQYRLRGDVLKTSSVRRGSEFETKHPKLFQRTSSADLVFEMDEIESKVNREPSNDQNRTETPRQLQGSEEAPSSTPSFPDGSRRIESSLPSERSPDRARSSSLGFASVETESAASTTNASVEGGQRRPSGPSSSPWMNQPLGTSKLDMKQIMAQASAHQTSNISAAMSKGGLPRTASGSRPSQKERKRQLQEQQQQQQRVPPIASSSRIASNPKSAAEASPAPWQTVTRASHVSLKDILDAPPEAQEPPPPKSRVASAPALTLRQTVPGNVASSRKASAAIASTSKSPDQPRLVSPRTRVSDRPSSSISPSASPNTSQPTRSVRHAPPTAEPSLQLSMADILAQQQTEKDVLREVTTARRSLREIQEEQAFQEWWDQEEAATKARMQADEAGPLTKRGEAGGLGRGQRSGRGSARGRDRGSSRGRGRQRASETP